MKITQPKCIQRNVARHWVQRSYSHHGERDIHVLIARPVQWPNVWCNDRILHVFHSDGAYKSLGCGRRRIRHDGIGQQCECYQSENVAINWVRDFAEGVLRLAFSQRSMCTFSEVSMSRTSLPKKHCSAAHCICSIATKSNRSYQHIWVISFALRGMCPLIFVIQCTF